MCEYVFAALELLMTDCVLATEPSTSAILVTNNLFKYWKPAQMQPQQPFQNELWRIGPRSRVQRL